MKEGLKTSIKNRFDAMELDDRQFAGLEKLQDQTTVSSPSYLSRWFRHTRVMAATIFLGFMIFGGYHAYRIHSANLLVDAIVLEAVNNHLNLKPLEVKNAQLSEVLKYFDMLSFKPVRSSAITGNPGDRLLGGRYCSILGIDAAQIRVQSHDGKISSWYQGMLSPDRLKYIPDVAQGGQPVVRAIKGMQVRLWQQDGVVFVNVR